MRNVAIVTMLASLLTSSVFASPIKVTEYDWYLENYQAPSGSRYGWYWDVVAWIDMEVENKDYEKLVTVYWTVDSWETTHESPAFYEASLESNFERWGLNLDVTKLQDCYWCDIDKAELEFAVKYEVNGEIYWDNNGGENYRSEIVSRKD